MYQKPHNPASMEFIHTKDPVLYPAALSLMEERVANIRHGSDQECVWLLEHPPLYTAGTSAKDDGLVSSRFPVFETGRGGEYTYHGPGQRVAYVMLNLMKYQKAPDIKQYIWLLEEWIIQTLRHFDIHGERRTGRVGIWVIGKDGREAKIAAIGVRIRHWITFHGISINVDPDLSHFDGIIPCGIREFGVTSMAKELGRSIDLRELDAVLECEFEKVFAVLLTLQDVRG